jgi:hypothetical protein
MRATVFRFVVTAEERAQLTAAARATRSPSVSAWARAVLLYEAERLEASQPAVGAALETVRTHLSAIMVREGQ